MISLSDSAEEHSREKKQKKLRILSTQNTRKIWLQQKNR